MADDDSQPLRGYHRLAHLMGNFSETAIFRRFSTLNMVNLLTLQAELLDLETQLHDIWSEDGERDIEKNFAVNLFAMIRSPNSMQAQMATIIRDKLKEYNTALLEVAQIAKLSSPEEVDLKFLREWLVNEGEGDKFLEAGEAFTWQPPMSTSKTEKKLFDQDLLTLQAPPVEQDTFSRLLSSRLLYFWASIRSPFSRSRAGQSDPEAKPDPLQKWINSDSGVLQYSDEALVRFNNIVISVIGAVLPVVAIVALYFIRSEGARIGAMAGFTLVFALAMAIFTNARRLEIAASTAAFAAVEVVFIGSSLTSR